MMHVCMRNLHAWNLYLAMWDLNDCLCCEEVHSYVANYQHVCRTFGERYVGGP